MNKKPALQGLRALAIGSIVLFHCGNPHLYQLACAAVCLFFIMSGYLRGYRNAKNTSNSAVPSFKDSFSFSITRIAPLYPLHVIMTFIAIPFSDIIPSLANEGISKLPFWIVLLFTNLTLTKSLIPKYYFGYNGVSWFLSSYFILLLLTPLLQWLFRKHCKTKSSKILLACAVLVFHLIYCYLISRITTNIEYWTYIFPLSRLPEYIIGMSAGSIIAESSNDEFQSTVLWHQILQFISVVFLIILIFFIDMPQWIYRSLAFIVPITFLVLTTDIKGTYVNNILSQRAFVFIGNLSAYIFLIHQVLYNACTSFGFVPDSFSNRLIIFIVIMTSSSILSILYQKSVFVNKS